MNPVEQAKIKLIFRKEFNLNIEVATYADNRYQIMLKGDDAIKHIDFEEWYCLTTTEWPKSILDASTHFMSAWLRWNLGYTMDA